MCVYTCATGWLSSLTVLILICSSEDAKLILPAAENLGLHTGEFVFIILQQLEVGADESSTAPAGRGNKHAALAMRQMH